MTAIHEGPIDHPAAWKGGDFASKDDFAFDLGPAHLAAFDRAVEAVNARGLAAGNFSREDFDLSAIAGDVAAILHELLKGRGVVLVRGFPVERYDTDDMAKLYWGLGTHWGRAVSQSRMGDRLGHVIDVSGDNPRERGYRSSKELALHTDSDNIVGMMCLRNAKSGGTSRLVSTLAIHNEIGASHPEYLAPLYEGFRYHWRGEEPAGEPPITPYPVPVFSLADGVVSCVYLRYFIDLAAEELGELLPEAGRAALDHFDEVANREDMVLAFDLEPGETIFFNNYTTLHSRTGFVDHDDPDRKRHLLRMWLDVPGGRPLAAPVRRYYGTDGIKGRGDGDTIYQGETLLEH